MILKLLYTCSLHNNILWDYSPNLYCLPFSRSSVSHQYAMMQPNFVVRLISTALIQLAKRPPKKKVKMPQLILNASNTSQMFNKTVGHAFAQLQRLKSGKSKAVNDQCIWMMNNMNIKEHLDRSAYL